MIVLGFILIIVAAAAVLFAVIATGTLTASPLSAVGITVSVTPLTMFVAGAVALLLVVLGLALISRGTKRSVHTRRELRHLRKERANQPAAAGAAAGGTTRTDTANHDRRATGRGPEDRGAGLGDDRRGSAGDLPGNQPRGNEYPPASR
jgi:membrane protein implicated in regulation of membrane protease activity